MAGFRKQDKIWQNLLADECPLCGLPLHEAGSIWLCSQMCGFQITAVRNTEVVVDLQSKEYVTGIDKILPNGKVKFKSAKVFKGIKQPFNLGF